MQTEKRLRLISGNLPVSNNSAPFTDRKPAMCFGTLELLVRKMPLVVLLLCGAWLGFMVLTGGRGMSEQFVFCSGLLLLSCAMILSVLMTPVFLLYMALVIWLGGPPADWRRAGRLFCAAALVGAFTGQGVMLADEWNFAREVDALRQRSAGAPVTHSRPRIWPCESCGMVYIDGEGFSAHD